MRKALPSRNFLILLAATAMCVIGLPVYQPAPNRSLARAQKAGSDLRTPVIEDWTHHHLIYSAPGSIGRTLALQQQPRYVQQYLRRYVLPGRTTGWPGHTGTWRYRPNGFARDWGIATGNGYTVGQGNFPAKYVFDVNAAPSCTADYVVFTTSQNGAATTDIYAVNNLYVNSAGTGLCSGTNPTVLWAYHIQSQGGAAITSPVVSFAGDQIAWIESGGGRAALHILKPYTGGGDGTIAAPHTPTASASAAAYHSCVPAAPSGTTSNACLLNLLFANGSDDNGGAGSPISPSSFYYDYIGDFGFAWDNNSNVHEFTNVFKGAPAEVTSGGWPVALLPADTNPALSSPVYDETSQNVFVGNSSGRVYYVRVVGASSGTCNAGSNGGAPPCVGSSTFTDGNTTNTKIAPAPIVDSATQRIFVYFGPSGAGGPGGVVGQDDTTLSAANQFTVNVGAGSGHRLNAGALDNAYYTTDNGLGQGTGWLYVCGNGSNGGPTGDYALLQRIAVTNAKLGRAVDSTQWLASNASARCNPITEFYNPNTSVDYLFFAVETTGAANTPCVGNGCIYAATVTGGTLKVPTTPLPANTGAVNASGGTSGIIVDNDSTSTGAASIYFTWLANGNGTATYTCNGATTTSVCAVKLTQSGLQ